VGLEEKLPRQQGKNAIEYTTEGKNKGVIIVKKLPAAPEEKKNTNP